MAFVFLMLVLFIDHYCGGYLISIAYCPFFSLKSTEIFNHNFEQDEGFGHSEESQKQNFRKLYESEHDLLAGLPSVSHILICISD